MCSLHVLPTIQQTVDRIDPLIKHGTIRISYSNLFNSHKLVRKTPKLPNLLNYAEIQCLTCRITAGLHK